MEDTKEVIYKPNTCFKRVSDSLYSSFDEDEDNDISF